MKLIKTLCDRLWKATPDHFDFRPLCRTLFDSAVWFQSPPNRPKHPHFKQRKDARRMEFKPSQLHRYHRLINRSLNVADINYLARKKLFKK